MADRHQHLRAALQSASVALLREADEVLGTTGSLAVDQALSLVGDAQLLLQHHQDLVPDGPLPEPRKRKAARRD